MEKMRKIVFNSIQNCIRFLELSSKNIFVGFKGSQKFQGCYFYEKKFKMEHLRRFKGSTTVNLFYCVQFSLKAKTLTPNCLHTG